ncbi:hypothetical protein ElyMa_003943200 [Elysia marginata]|uniref:Uncharacterized protein n=1 Tax=Elysia marginata TaxID=1093978 RepID=A0AAV4FUC9_9GAST|nr:hypothetical protein ElyMa_003943200 [Elysia marginata]
MPAISHISSTSMCGPDIYPPPTTHKHPGYLSPNKVSKYINENMEGVEEGATGGERWTTVRRYLQRIEIGTDSCSLMFMPCGSVVPSVCRVDPLSIFDQETDVV